jgi:hypothetical protein
VSGHLVFERLLEDCQFILSLRADLLLSHRRTLDFLQRLTQTIQLIVDLSLLFLGLGSGLLLALQVVLGLLQLGL